MAKPKLLAIAGPTASGKTALGVRLAGVFGGEVVSADSMQLYKGMDIATAMPSPAEMKGIPHHLLGILDPAKDSCSAADYAIMAKSVIADIHKRGNLPILVGGTGLYMAAVVDGTGFSRIPDAPEIRKSLCAWADTVSPEVLHKRLEGVDPLLAAQLHPNDRKRILRGLEVYEASHVPLSQWQQSEREHRGEGAYDLLFLGLDYPLRQDLYHRINCRVERMLEQGLVQEAASMRQYYAKTAVQAIGYKELEPYFLGNSTLEDCVEKLKQSTRRYAKRQLTWFRHRQDIQWLYAQPQVDLEKPFCTAENTVHKWLDL